jgi:hypothetical protein
MARLYRKGNCRKAPAEREQVTTNWGATDRTLRTKEEEQIHCPEGAHVDFLLLSKEEIKKYRLLVLSLFKLRLFPLTVLPFSAIIILCFLTMLVLITSSYIYFPPFPYLPVFFLSPHHLLLSLIKMRRKKDPN